MVNQTQKSGEARLYYIAREYPILGPDFKVEGWVEPSGIDGAWNLELKVWGGRGHGEEMESGTTRTLLFSETPNEETFSLIFDACTYGFIGRQFEFPRDVPLTEELVRNLLTAVRHGTKRGKGYIDIP